jgi:protein ImuA
VKISLEPDHLASYPIWRGTQGYSPRAVVATQCEALDRLLPGGGLPIGELTEIVSQRHGMGELSFLMPALRRLSDQQQGWIIWVTPPFIPYAPALQSHGLHLDRLLVVQTEESECLWAAEQALRSACCIALLAWPETVSRKSSRRLQLAAEEQQCLTVLFRSSLVLAQESSATLRLQWVRENSVNRLRIVKCRGCSPQSIDPGFSDFGKPTRAGGAA